jgi:hypothetical protein
MDRSQETVVERLHGSCGGGHDLSSCPSCAAAAAITTLLDENASLRRQNEVMKRRDEKYMRFVAFVAQEMSTP